MDSASKGKRLLGVDLLVEKTTDIGAAKQEGASSQIDGGHTGHC